jgi:hypothetical protein
MRSLACHNEVGISAQCPSIPVRLRRMMTTIGTPSSQRMMLFIEGSPRTDSIGTNKPSRRFLTVLSSEVNSMHELIYLVGLVVVVMVILSALGLH